jgi:hypothetical protein
VHIAQCRRRHFTDENRWNAGAGNRSSVSGHVADSCGWFTHWILLSLERVSNLPQNPINYFHLKIYIEEIIGSVTAVTKNPLFQEISSDQFFPVAPRSC